MIQGTEMQRNEIKRKDCILNIIMDTRENMSIIYFAGDMNDPAMAIETYKG